MRGSEAFSAFGKHLWVDVGDYNTSGGVAVDGGGVVEESEGDVACAASDVEDCLSGRVMWAGSVGGGESDTRIERTNEMVFPETVDAEGHEVVHGIVVRSDRGEDSAHCTTRTSAEIAGRSNCPLPTSRCLELFRDGLKAEMRRLVALEDMLTRCWLLLLAVADGGGEGSSAVTTDEAGSGRQTQTLCSAW